MEDLNALSGKQRAHPLGHVEGHFALDEIVMDGARVLAAVPGIEHDRTGGKPEQRIA